MPVGDARGNTEDFFTFKNYGLVYGIGFHFNAKYAANKKGTIYPFITGGFCQLQNDEISYSCIDSNTIANGYPLPGSLTYSKTLGSCLLALRVIHAGIGVQYYFNTRHPLLPFAGVEFDYNYIWGYYEQEPLIVAGNAPTQKTTFNINHASRFGIGLDIGLDYRITQYLGFVFGAKYKIANLIGKNSEKTNPASVTPGDLNSMNLLDEAATELNTNLNKNRNISYFQFYIGFSVFAGRR